MKNTTVLKKFTAAVLAAAFLVSAASCSSDSDSRDKDETNEEETTAEETAATEETTKETAEVTSEETTAATTEETTTEETTTDVAKTVFDDPDTAALSDPDLRALARDYLDRGYKLEFMDHEAGISAYGEGTNIVEGFIAIGPNDNLFMLDHAVKFPDRVSADAFIEDFSDSDYKPVVTTENPDGTVSLDIADGYGHGTLYTNNILVIVLAD